MRLIGLDNKSYSIQPPTKIRGNASKLSIEAYNLLKEIFPFDIIFNEVTIRGGKSILYLDFLVDSIGIEVDGAQHSSFNSHFHHHKAHFLRSQILDRDKEEFCRINNFSFVRLRYNEKDKWREIIENRENR